MQRGQLMAGELLLRFRDRVDHYRYFGWLGRKPVYNVMDHFLLPCYLGGSPVAPTRVLATSKRF